MGHRWKRVGTGLWVVLAVMGVTVVTLVGLARGSEQHPPGKELLITVADVQPLHARGAVLVVDVREAESFANGHIPGAVHLLARDVEAQAKAVKTLAKGRLIVTYCSCPTEASSLRAAKILSGVKAKALLGGFPKWVESGGAIER